MMNMMMINGEHDDEVYQYEVYSVLTLLSHHDAVENEVFEEPTGGVEALLSLCEVAQESSDLSSSTSCGDNGNTSSASSSSSGGNKRSVSALYQSDAIDASAPAGSSPLTSSSSSAASSSRTRRQVRPNRFLLENSVVPDFALRTLSGGAIDLDDMPVATALSPPPPSAPLSMTSPAASASASSSGVGKAGLRNRKSGGGNAAESKGRGHDQEPTHVLLSRFHSLPNASTASSVPSSSASPAAAHRSQSAPPGASAAAPQESLIDGAIDSMDFATTAPNSPDDADASGSGGMGTSNFPHKLFDMVSSEDPAVVGWMPLGNGFHVRDSSRFVSEVLPRHFKRKKIFFNDIDTMMLLSLK